MGFFCFVFLLAGSSRKGDVRNEANEQQMPGVTFQIKGKHFVLKLCARLFNLTLGARGQQTLTLSMNLLFTPFQFALKKRCPVELGNQMEDFSWQMLLLGYWENAAVPNIPVCCMLIS